LSAETAVEPFRIEIPDERLDDLRARLRRVRWADEIDNDQWQRGASLEFLRELISYWRDRFDWRAVEAKLNELPHFRTEIDGVDIHFVHQRSVEHSPLPLIATHGWPSTFHELTRLLPLLPDYDVVLPSLPGFGFSSIPAERYVHRRVPELWIELMERLGYERFAAHGGDLGGGVTARLGMYHPQRLVGIHVTNVYGSAEDSRTTEAERLYLRELAIGAVPAILER
jgi:hypothetical protein